ncbi:MAG: hypothetical protein A2283_01970 [Lentisphaerae bacterium RIFOXYA12_FULL_48_11]|nr:MAG: hypothetical protein A2283_01970 [Lentisphaerae bacterium RIFOXYA12_FULL_48_11]
MDRKAWTCLWGAAVAVYVLLGVMNLFFGELNQDEGWYLYAARMVTEGRYPYIDFAYPQGPVLPFVYVLAQPLVDMFGVAGGRLFSALLGFVGVGMVSLLAARLVSPERSRIAAFMAFCLAGINVYQSYYLTSVKTYSLCGLLIIAGLLVLTFANGNKAWLAACLSGFLFATAAGTRISAIVVIPVVFLVLFIAVVQVRKWQDTIDSSGAGAIIGNAVVSKINPFIWLWFAAGAMLAALVIFLPFVIKSPAALWFSLVEYHAGRSAGSMVSLFAYKAGFVSRLVQAYFVPAALFLAGIVYLVLNRGKQSAKSLFSVVGEAPLLRAIIIGMWLSIVVVSLVHMSAPFPYEDYQVMIFPLFAVALAVMLAGIAVSEPGQVSGFPVAKGEAWFSLVVILLCVASSFSSPINQAWFAGQRDRIWWPLRDEAPLRKLQRVAGVVKSMTKPGDVLLTQDVYLAVETGLRLPKGLEMGQFSYFPFWSRGKAAACHVLNREMMLELLSASEAPVAAFSGYGLTIGSPAVVRLPKAETDILWDAVNARYMALEDVPNFGQADTTLRILIRKK